MSRELKIALVFVGIIILASIVSFIINLGADHKAYEIIPIELKVAERLNDGEVWNFSGSVYDTAEIKMIVKDPLGNIVTEDTITPKADRSFDILLTTGGPLWDKDGKYILILEQGEFKEIQTFRVNQLK